MEPKTEERESNENAGKEEETEKTEKIPANEPPPDSEPPKVKENELEENGGAQSEIQIENKEITNNWETQASESKEEKEKVEEVVGKIEEKTEEGFTPDEGTQPSQNEWKVCDFQGATDYIPCLDNKEAIDRLPSTKHYEHRERHCPSSAPTCIVPLPQDYRSPIKWPQSRNEVYCFHCLLLNILNPNDTPRLLFYFSNLSMVSNGEKGMMKLSIPLLV